jgi:hypothetical protein
MNIIEFEECQKLYINFISSAQLFIDNSINRDYKDDIELFNMSMHKYYSFKRHCCKKVKEDQYNKTYCHLAKDFYLKWMNNKMKNKYGNINTNVFK